jgi:pimeloyl-ACP methyl ester carboxylesterase
MLAVLEHAAVDRATIVGFSLGGGIALEMALIRPAAVAGLVLVAPVMPDRPFEAAFMDNLKAVARCIRSEGLEAAMAGPWASSPLFARSLEKEGVREKLQPILADFPGADYLASERDRSPREWLVPDRLDRIHCATTVVVGGDEMPGFSAFAEEAAQGIAGAVLERMDGCGHLLPLEDAERLARLILSD